MPKIALIGAGSYYFAKAIISDILSYPELRDSTISLMDIAQEPLDLITTFGQKLAKQHGFKTHIESTIDRQEALKGADLCHRGDTSWRFRSNFSRSRNRG